MKNETLLKFAKKTIIENHKKTTTTKNEFFALENDSWVLKQNSTKGNWEKFKAGEIDDNTMKERAYKRYLDKREKSLNEDLERAEKAINEGSNVEYVSISVDWVRSRTWGYNPHATIDVKDGEGYHTYEGAASGCGYDKRSAATAQALNCSKSIRKLLWELAYKERNGDKTYGYYVFTNPHFEGGVGFSCHRNVLQKMGLNCKVYDERGKHNDYYVFER